jgi:hypothetical protein
VPAAYQHDLCKRLRRLDQGDMSVQDYYAEMQRGMIRPGCILKYRTLFTERNRILLIICSSLLSWPKKNCRVAN